MNTLKETFVIVRANSEHVHDYIQEFISFDKKELEAKCSELNEEGNSKWKAHYEKREARKKNPKTWNPITLFTVKDLETAISEHRDTLIDYYSEQDESY
jgi:hypothetical protein